MVKIALQNYFNHNFGDEELFSPVVFQTFIYECLDYPHWHQSKSQFESELKAILLTLSKHGNWTFRLEDVHWPTENQVISIESFNVWIETIGRYLRDLYSPSCEHRIIYDSLSQKALGIILQGDGSTGNSLDARIKVQQFDRKFTIRKGELQPLRNDLIIHYTAGLDLDPKELHKIEVSTYMTAHFKPTTENNVAGAIIRGYIFQKFFELRNEPLNSYPRLFYTLKRIEHFLIKRDSDPFYRDLVNSLESLKRDVLWEKPEAFDLVPELLAKTQNALDYVFTDDKLLTLLLRDLQNTLNQKGKLQWKHKEAERSTHKDVSNLAIGKNQMADSTADLKTNLGLSSNRVTGKNMPNETILYPKNPQLKNYHLEESLNPEDVTLLNP